MLKAARYFEIGKDEDKDEEIINRERELDEVSGNEFEAALLTLGPKYEAGKNPCERDPNGAPDGGLAIVNRMCLAIKESEVQTQHKENEGAKTDP